MKKIYLLTCVNEESALVSNSLHKTKKEALAEMRKQYHAEKSDPLNGEYWEGECYIGRDQAVVGWGGEYFYRWEITKTLLPCA